MVEGGNIEGALQYFSAVEAAAWLKRDLDSVTVLHAGEREAREERSLMRSAGGREGDGGGMGELLTSEAMRMVLGVLLRVTEGHESEVG